MENDTPQIVRIQRILWILKLNKTYLKHKEYKLNTKTLNLKHFIILQTSSIELSCNHRSIIWLSITIMVMFDSLCFSDKLPNIQMMLRHAIYIEFCYFYVVHEYELRYAWLRK